jgi:hypothetical protein
MNELPTPRKNIDHKDHGHPISGSEGKRARAECREQHQARQRVYEIMDRHLGAAFEELDRLHQGGVDDRDIIAALEDGGYPEEADSYQEWIAEDDPSRDYRDPTPYGAYAVTDPVDALSYRALEAELKAQREQKEQQNGMDGEPRREP